LRGNKVVTSYPPRIPIICPTFLTLLIAVGVCAQSSSQPITPPQPAEQPAPVNTQPDTATDPDAVRSRIERARALAAAHQLTVAAAELEAVRKRASDDVIRNITSVMLMGIYLEEGNYVRAKSLLDEDFQSRLSRSDASLRTYFATAGQALNGARQRIARYRTFGMNVSDANLPAEAIGDLDRLRSLIERLAAQAREIVIERKTYDALALLEDVLGIRVSLARDVEDRATWEAEYATAREGLASNQTQIAALGGTPPLQRSASKPMADVATATKELPPTATEPNASRNAPPPPATNTVVAPTEAPAQTNPPSSTSAQPNQPAQPTKPTQTPAENAPKPEETRESTPRTLSTGILNSRATKRVVPAYPPIAKQSGTKGIVRVHVTIDEGGKVMNINSSEGPLLLRQSAEAAARAWRFSPTVVDGKTVRLTGYIEFNFTL
jgi:periplasmic protein TonB